MDNSPLYDFIQQVDGEDHLRVQDDLGDGYVRLRAAEAQRRQAKQDIRTFEDVVLELLRNSRDADAHLIFVATWTEGNYRKLTILDDGKGIPESMHEIVFEPFVTSKLDSFHADRWGVHGRGMALYSIRENVDRASIVRSAPQRGAIFSIESDLGKLPEKRDQSTLPTVSEDDQGQLVLRGPHNIARTVLEFAIDERKSIAVYLGSPSEIIATLHELGSKAAFKLDSILQPMPDSGPYVHQFAFASTPDELSELAQSCRLPISPRNARRILNGEIPGLPPHLSRLVRPMEPTPKAPSKAKGAGPRVRSPHIPADDLDTFKDSVAHDFAAFAPALYLNPHPDISAQVRNGNLVISIPLDSLDEPLSDG